MSPARWRALAWAVGVTGVLAALIVVGSRRLAHFDAALVGYTFATLFAAFAITYRHTMWLQRPPTRMYWRRGWGLLTNPHQVGKNLSLLAVRFVETIVFNRFIWARGRMRWLAHLLILWGCVIALAITLPLVFGWLHFEAEPIGEGYRVHVFGWPTVAFPVHSIPAFLIFHGLVWASLLVIAGVMLAFWRRLRDHGAAALQQFGEDVLPLVLLFAISVTGLMLMASYTWLKGYGYDFLAILHALTVIVWLLWLPFGKFFHIIQRPGQVAVAVYKEYGQIGEQAHCKRCGQPYASRAQIEDLIAVERQLGYRYEMARGPARHYQEICPPCRRALLALSQAALIYPHPPGTPAVGAD